MIAFVKASVATGIDLYGEASEEFILSTFHTADAVAAALSGCGFAIRPVPQSPAIELCVSAALAAARKLYDPSGDSSAAHRYADVLYAYCHFTDFASDSLPEVLLEAVKLGMRLSPKGAEWKLARTIHYAVFFLSIVHGPDMKLLTEQQEAEFHAIFKQLRELYPETDHLSMRSIWAEMEMLQTISKGDVSECKKLADKMASEVARSSKAPGSVTDVLTLSLTVSTVGFILATSPETTSVGTNLMECFLGALIPLVNTMPKLRREATTIVGDIIICFRGFAHSGDLEIVKKWALTCEKHWAHESPFAAQSEEGNAGISSALVLDILSRPLATIFPELAQGGEHPEDGEDEDGEEGDEDRFEELEDIDDEGEDSDEKIRSRRTNKAKKKSKVASKRKSKRNKSESGGISTTAAIVVVGVAAAFGIVAALTALRLLSRKESK